MLGLLGKKKGMTRIFNADGSAIPVTVVEVGPCSVVQKKTLDNDGYSALQLGFGMKQPRVFTRPMRGHFEKNGLSCFAHLNEFRADNLDGIDVGDELLVSGFQVGDIVDVQGCSKGRGFQGVMKRHGKHGGPAAHGSDFHRSPGSIGMRADPGRVFKNMKLPGHYGVDTVMMKNLRIVDVRPDDNVILIRGAVPGSREGLLKIILKSDALKNRQGLKVVAARNESQDANIPKTEVSLDVQNVAKSETGVNEIEK